MKMKKPTRNVADEIIADLKDLHATLKAGIPLREFAVAQQSSSHSS